MFLKLFLKKWIAWICERWIHFRWWLLRPYYDGLLVQAKYLYRQHFLFQERYRLFGLDFAEKAFEWNVDDFFNRAKKEPFRIRAKIFLDTTLERELKPYYL